MQVRLKAVSKQAELEELESKAQAVKNELLQLQKNLGATRQAIDLKREEFAALLLKQFELTAMNVIAEPALGAASVTAHGKFRPARAVPFVKTGDRHTLSTSRRPGSSGSGSGA